NMRISDFIMYFLIVYSFFNLKEYAELYYSKVLLIVKILLLYFGFQFIISVILYEQNIIEYFFRLKILWLSFFVFPFLLLIKRGGVQYLARLVFPVAVVSNILYILSYITGIALMPEISIEKQNLPGGLQVNRIFGGTFYGEFFFLYFVFIWITDKIRPAQLLLAMLFITPHILAFGRASWAFFAFTIILIFLWNFLKKREFKILLKQGIVLTLFIGAMIYSFNRFFPQSEYLTEAIGARIEQGQENLENLTGTYGTRMANSAALIQLWLNSNVMFGIGMHPMIVIKPATSEELIYAWGFSDVRWSAILAAYGLTGFIIVVLFQIYYLQKCFMVLKKTKNSSVYTFFTIMFFSTMLFDTLINYSYNLVTVRLWGLSDILSLYLASLIYEESTINS
ncbi:MAG: hypothetical protein L0Y79_10135, partial [Chlorobi bacterium]|nr:hypothetical protein [Chlorobiota bacterium]